MDNYNDYIREIKNLGRWIVRHAEDIVLTEDDYKNKLRSLTLYTKFEPGNIPMWDIDKEFMSDREPIYCIDNVRIHKTVIDRYHDNLVECTTWGDAAKNTIRYVSIGICDELNEILEKYKDYDWSVEEYENGE